SRTPGDEPPIRPRSAGPGALLDGPERAPGWCGAPFRGAPARARSLERGREVSRPAGYPRPGTPVIPAGPRLAGKHGCSFGRASLQFGVGTECAGPPVTARRAD